MWYSITEYHLSVPLAAMHAPPHLHLACPLPLPLCSSRPPCVPLAHCTCHLAVPSSPHALCCHAPRNRTHLLTMPVAATHAAHLAATMAMTTATTPKQREYCDHPHHSYHIVSMMSTTSATHDHHDKPRPPQPWRAHSGSGWRPSLACHIGTV